MLKNLMVIDDFYGEPEKAREFAINLDYPDPGPNVHYPGRNSKQSMAWPNMDQMFSQIVGEPIERRGALPHGFCRISLEGSERTGCGVHIDHGCTWAGIVFLTLDEHCRDGLGFYRHRKFKTDRAPLSDKEAQDIFGVETQEDAIRLVVPAEGTTKQVFDGVTGMDQWERTMFVPMKFNRLVLFRAWMFHSGGLDFGDSIENGRLVQLFFWQSPKQKGA